MKKLNKKNKDWIRYYFNLQNYNNISWLVISWFDYINLLLEYALKKQLNWKDDDILLDTFIVNNIALIKAFMLLTNYEFDIESVWKDKEKIIKKLMEYNGQIREIIETDIKIEKIILNKKWENSKEFNKIITYFYD